MSASAPKRPNVIVFFTDQQRWDTTGVHGNPLGLTPNFDRMATRGHAPLQLLHLPAGLRPGPGSLQTGLYATRPGCFRNGIPLPDDATTLARCFGDAGYHTGYIGKWHLGTAVRRPLPEPQRGGYQYWLAANILEFTSDAYSTVVYDNDGNAVKLPGYRVDALTDAAIRYIDGHQREPFFLFLSFLEPHHQNHLDDYPPPTATASATPGAGPRPTCRRWEGRRTSTWAATGGWSSGWTRPSAGCWTRCRSLELLDNTIVLFTSDHGCHFKTRNERVQALLPRELRRASRRLLTGPASTAAGRSASWSAWWTCRPRCWMRRACAVPAEMQGRSILPLLWGERSRRGRRRSSSRSARRSRAGRCGRSAGSTASSPRTRTEAANTAARTATSSSTSTTWRPTRTS